MKKMIIKFILKANSIYKKIILTKNGAGEVTNYQLEAEVIFLINHQIKNKDY